MTVLRHDPDADASVGAQSLADVVGALLPGARERAELLPAVLNNAMRWAGWAAAADSDGPDLDRSLRLASQAGGALFGLVAGAAGPFRLGDEQVVARPTGPRADAGPELFRVAFLVAAVVRDTATLSQLAALPMSALAAPGSSADECLSLRARALQTAWLRRPEAMAAVDAALAATAADRVRTTPAGTLKHEVIPELEALRALISEDNRELDRALRRLLEQHQRYRGEGDGRRDPAHLISIGALGIMAMAHDRGLRISSSSEYTPLRLIRGELDRSMPAMGLSEDGEGPLEFLLCRFCGTTIAPHSKSCLACGSDHSNTDPLVLTPEQLGAMGHAWCVGCGEQLLATAVRCPRCRAWQQGEGEDGADEVALRAFPSELQLHLVARVYAPSRLAALLPRDPPDPDMVIGRLRRAGFAVDEAAPARRREAPDAPWEFEIALRSAGDAVPTLFQVWPAGLGTLPGFDRAALGVGVAPGEHAVVVSTRFGRDLLRDLHRQVKVIDAVAPDMLAVVDFSTGRARTASWGREAAQGPVPPDPADLYAISTVRSADGARAWLHTDGLARCGCFELEMIDVPGDEAERFAELLDAAARRLIERGETVPPDEQPFAVAEGVSLCWVPSRWARDDAGVGGFGAVDEDRVGFTGSSAALLYVDADGPAPIGVLAGRLAALKVPDSRLDTDRDRAAAVATLGRFKALRLAHVGIDAWGFLARLRTGEGPEAAWFRVEGLDGDRIRGSLVGDAGGTGLSKGHAGVWSMGALVDWEIECPEGRITPADVLIELATSRREASANAREPEERTPLLVERRVAMEQVTMEPQAGLTFEELASIADGAAREVRRRKSVPEPEAETLEPERSWTPVILSLLLPGAGHLWLGESRRGWMFLGIGVITLFGCGIVNGVAAWDVYKRTRGAGA